VRKVSRFFQVARDPREARPSSGGSDLRPAVSCVSQSPGEGDPPVRPAPPSATRLMPTPRGVVQHAEHVLLARRSFCAHSGSVVSTPAAPSPAPPHRTPWRIRTPRRTPDAAHHADRRSCRARPDSGRTRPGASGGRGLRRPGIGNAQQDAEAETDAVCLVHEWGFWLARAARSAASRLRTRKRRLVRPLTGRLVTVQPAVDVDSRRAGSAGRPQRGAPSAARRLRDRGGRSAGVHAVGFVPELAASRPTRPRNSAGGRRLGHTNGRTRNCRWQVSAGPTVRDTCPLPA
jgi:hypothetical protein